MPIVKSELMDEAAVRRSLARMTHEIIEKNKGAEKLCLVGIRRRGLPIAEQLASNIARFEGVEVPVGSVDVTLYRDDLTQTVDIPTASAVQIPADVRTHTVILVDDVIYTGRTARAAIEAVFTRGRPSVIQLAVLIDRGHRELPIRPDFVGKSIPTARDEIVQVMMDEYDGMTAVRILEKE